MGRKKTRFEYRGYVSGKEINLDGPMRSDIMEHFQGRDFTVILKANQEARRGWEHRYWFGVLVRDVMEAVNEQCGESFMINIARDKEIIHRMICRNCLHDPHQIVDPDTGELLMTVEPGVSDLGHEDWLILIEDARRWAFNIFGVMIYPPESQAKLFDVEYQRELWTMEQEQKDAAKRSSRG